MKELGKLTTHCIRCGFCLEACPTFTTTGRETDSPRGRIYLVRSAVEGKLDWDEDVRPHLDRCLGCLACVTACPSGVEYGDILEMARDRMDSPLPKRALLALTTNPALLRANLALGGVFGKRVPGFVSRLLSGEPPEADQPKAQTPVDFPPLDESILPPVRGEVYMLEGCAMRVLYPNVHAATRRLLRQVGYEVRETDQGCCGAMHAHNGDLKGAAERAQASMRDFPDDLPVIVNSAGCGSTMKHYGDLLSGADAPAREFASRVKDLSEFLFEAGLTKALANTKGLDTTVTYHDACHLAHGQGIRDIPRLLIKAIPNLRYVELEEADTCCGSAGVYNVLQPKMARSLLKRKWENVARTRASVVATGNPGCHAWIAQAAREHGETIEVVHTAELLERAFMQGL